MRAKPGVLGGPGSSAAAAGAALLRPDALASLVCPVCRARLELVPAPDAGSLTIRCVGCARIYPVLDGIPVLLRDRALGGI